MRVNDLVTDDAGQLRPELASAKMLRVANTYPPGSAYAFGSSSSVMANR